MYSRIIVGYQDTEQGRDALELGRVLAQANRAELLPQSWDRGAKPNLQVCSRGQRLLQVASALADAPA